MSDGAYIFELQTALSLLARPDNGIPQLIPDGVFGEETSKAVREFQKLYGMNPSGQVDQAVWDKLMAEAARRRELSSPPFPLYLFSSPFPSSEGMTVSQTAVLQIILGALSDTFSNCPSVSVNGQFDNSTKKALQALQRICGLEESGQLDPLLWNRLAALFQMDMQHIFRST